MPPISVMIKPASGSCNMRCRYCFYADEQENREVGSYGVMSLSTMRNLVDRALDYAEYACSFTFQGGEPTLAGLDYFREFVKYVGERTQERRTGMYSAAASQANAKTQPAAASLQDEDRKDDVPADKLTGPQKRRPASRIQIRYALQTNGYAITEEWARFFAENHFLIGVSLDGTKEIHDRYRLDAAGKGTYQRVMDSIALLEKYRVDFNILTVITGPSARRGQKIYSFFRQQHFDYHQYIECLDPLEKTPGGHDYSLTPERLEQFLKSTFDAWYQDVAGGYYVSNRYFDNLLRMLYGREPESCNMRGVCGVQWIAEADGGMYPCDFYVLDQWRLGNVNENTFAEMDRRRAELGFMQESMRVPEECRTCCWAALCRNGCRRNRRMGAGEDGKTYFCSAYKGFFEYAYPRLAGLVSLGVGRPG